MSSEAKHTPGPWTVEETSAGGFSIYGPDDTPVVWDIGGIDTRPNADLIAAAPELLSAARAALEAVKTLHDELLGRDPQDGYFYKHELVAKLEAAIKRVEGD